MFLIRFLIFCGVFLVMLDMIYVILKFIVVLMMLKEVDFIGLSSGFVFVKELVSGIKN